MTRYEQLRPGIEFIAHKTMSLEQMAAEYAGEICGDVFNDSRQCNLCPMHEQCESLLNEKAGDENGRVEDVRYDLLLSICKELFTKYLQEEVT